MELERRVSGHFVRWVFEGVKGGPLAHGLRASGLDLDAMAEDYPAEKLPRWLFMLSESLHPSAPRGEALRRTGFDAAMRKRREVKSLGELMSGLPASVQRIGNFLDVSVREHGPYRYVAHFDDVDFLPTFFLGVLQGVTSSSTARPLEVTWSPEGLSGARYDFSLARETAAGASALALAR